VVNIIAVREYLRAAYFARVGVISKAQIAIGRMYIPARKLPVTSQASGVRNQ
jgi:hypothetical protein